MEGIKINKDNSLNRKIESISVLADCRRRQAEIRKLSLDLASRSELVDKEKVLDSLNDEIYGLNSPNEEDAQKELSDKENLYLEKADIFKDVPVFSAFNYGRVAKLKQIIGEDFKDCLNKAKEVLKKQNTKDVKLSDLESYAQIFGINKRIIDGEKTPEVKELADVALKDNKKISDIALVLKEEDREEFLSYFSENDKRRVSILLDAELSKVLSSKITEDDNEKIQAGNVHKRLAEYLKPEDEDTLPVIKILGRAIANLESDEANKILKDVAKVSLGQDKIDDFGKVARVVRSLAEADMISGKGLIMEFLGSKNLPDRYFNYFLDYLQKNDYLTKSLDLTKNWDDDKYERLFNYLVSNEEKWNDQVNVIDNFKRGVNLFGYKRMFDYVGRPDVSPHDALFNFKKIENICNISGLPEGQFFNNVLNQVKLDGSFYESGLSYNELNNILDSTDFSEEAVQRIKDKIERYKDIDRLQELKDSLKEPKDIFSSWLNIKKFVEISYLSNQTEVLNKLAVLKEEAVSDKKKENLLNFIESVAFSKTGKVEMKAVLDFWRKPQDFLERGDLHAPKVLHHAVKPSKYTEDQFLKLSAEEIRDSFIDGTLDKIQTFVPMEIIYSVDDKVRIKTELVFYGELKKEIGSRKDGTQNPKLFNEVKNIFKKYNINLTEYLLNKRENLDNFTPTTKDKIEIETRNAIKRFPNEKTSEKEEKRISGKYRARMNHKGDPQAVLAGNDTSCCMPFGSGKNNCYMWNPTIGLFTVEEEREAGWRTIAQSVVTLDHKISKNISEIKDKYKESSILVDNIGDDVIFEKEKYISCDNIEVATNFFSKKNVIESIYRDFFSKYSDYFNQNSDVLVNESKIIIGKSNSDLTFGEKEDNYYLPVSLPSYSDKLGKIVDVVHFDNKDNNSFTLKEDSIKKSEVNSPKKEIDTGIRDLTPNDVMSVSLLESKIYPKEMVEGLIEIQNRLISSAIYNKIHKKENLSTKYINSENKIAGYMIANEGSKDGERVIYIEDLAVLGDSKIGGGKMINSFLEKYAEIYLKKEDLVPIFLQAREETSYKIIEKQLEKIAIKLGFDIKTEEGRTYLYGNSKMHPMTFYPVRK